LNCVQFYSIKQYFDSLTIVQPAGSKFGVEGK